jgi:hypothetical protein
MEVEKSWKGAREVVATIQGKCFYEAMKVVKHYLCVKIVPFMV